MSRLIRASGTFATALIGLTAVGLLMAGSLTPPPGPVGPTMKTLREVEPRIPISWMAVDPNDPNSWYEEPEIPDLDPDPNEPNLPRPLGPRSSSTAVYVIDSPGSYYLDQNVNGESGKDGIAIQANNVTLDLNGFALIGEAGTYSAISIGGYTNIVIRNGTISDWDGRGIYGPSMKSGQVEGVSVADCGKEGIWVGYDFVVSRCTVRACGSQDAQPGFDGSQGCTFTECTSFTNGGHGIAAGWETTVRGCTARENGEYGIYFQGGVVHACTTADNGWSGIRCNANGVISNSTAVYNGDDGLDEDAYGINVGYYGVAQNCVARGNSYGGFWGDRCLMHGNTAMYNGGGPAYEDNNGTKGTNHGQ